MPTRGGMSWGLKPAAEECLREKGAGAHGKKGDETGAGTIKQTVCLCGGVGASGVGRECGGRQG